nr:hypothetical protein [Xylanimonas allomyrinae]
MRAEEHDGGARRRELAQQAGGERHEGDGEQECEHEPHQGVVGAFEELALGAVAEPEGAEGHEGERVRAELGQAFAELRPQLGGGPLGDADLEHDDGHDDGEDAVGEELQPPEGAQARP